MLRPPVFPALGEGTCAHRPCTVTVLPTAGGVLGVGVRSRGCKAAKRLFGSQVQALLSDPVSPGSKLTSGSLPAPPPDWDRIKGPTAPQASTPFWENEHVKTVKHDTRRGKAFKSVTKTVNYPAAAPTRPTQDLHGRKHGARQHKDLPTKRLPFPNRGPSARPGLGSPKD